MQPLRPERLLGPFGRLISRRKGTSAPGKPETWGVCMNASTSTPDDQRGLISPSIVERLHSGDAETWRRLLSELLPVAVEKLRGRFQLVGADSSLQAGAALVSAW